MAIIGKKLSEYIKQQIIKLRGNEHMRNQDVAERLGIHLNTVSRYYTRYLKGK